MLTLEAPSQEALRDENDSKLHKIRQAVRYCSQNQGGLTPAAEGLALG
jgi:hypothetical protein